MSDLVINISKLSAGHHERILSAEPSSIGLDARFEGTIHVVALLEKGSRQLLLEARLATPVRLTCDRCLDEFTQNIRTRYSIAYVTEERRTEDLEVNEEISILHPDTNVLDLGEDVRQFLLLAIPQKLLCNEECAGLCPKCGANRNRVQCHCAEEEVDPRWEALRLLQRN